MCFCFKKKTEYELRMSVWSSDVCSSDLRLIANRLPSSRSKARASSFGISRFSIGGVATIWTRGVSVCVPPRNSPMKGQRMSAATAAMPRACHPDAPRRSEEHTSELQSLMRISYADVCLKKKKNTHRKHILESHRTLTTLMTRQVKQTAHMIHNQHLRT